MSEPICTLCGKRPQDPECPVEMCGTSVEDTLGQENVCRQCYAEVVEDMRKGTRSERPADPAGEISGHTPWSDVKQRVLDRLQTENAKLEAQLLASQAECEQWKTWGIVEIAVRNPNVASYIEHWEGRALKAEAQVAQLTRPVSDEEWQGREMHTILMMTRDELDALLATRAQSTPPSPAPDWVRYALSRLAQKTEGEARALVEVISCRLGYGHASALAESAGKGE